MGSGLRWRLGGTMKPIDLQDIMQAIKDTGYVGFAMWSGWHNDYMACLITKDGKPDHSTNLWNYVENPEEALLKLQEIAIRNPV